MILHINGIHVLSWFIILGMQILDWLITLTHVVIKTLQPIHVEVLRLNVRI